MPNIRWKFHYFTSDSVSKAENIEGIADHFTGSDQVIKMNKDVYIMMTSEIINAL